MSGLGSSGSYPSGGGGDDVASLMLEEVTSAGVAAATLIDLLAWGVSGSGVAQSDVDGPPPYLPIGDSFTAGDLGVSDILPYLTERFSGADALTTLLQQYPTLSDEASVDEAIVFAMTAIATAEGTASDETVSLIAFFDALEDALIVGGLATCQASATEAVVAAAAFEALIAAGWKVDALGSAEFTAALLSELRIMVGLLAEANATSTATPILRLTVAAAEGVVAGDVIGTQLALFEQLTDGAEVYASVRLGDEEWSGWVLHTKLGAVTEYRNFPFNSVAGIWNTYYGLTDDGLFELAGDDDDGDPITAWIRTALETFGSLRRKRSPSVYLAWTAAGDMLLKVVAVDRKTKALTEDWYLATQVDDEDAHHLTRIKVGKGIEALSFAYELRNVAGADFAIDEIAWLPLILSGGI
jgi:hypothetical protein